MKVLKQPEFDLGPIVEQMGYKPEFKDWTPDRIMTAIRGYRVFLAECKANPETPLTPDRDVDMVWHQHMLNSKRYFDDCRAYFGYYLHHLPKEHQGGHCNVCSDTGIDSRSRAEPLFA